jgi:hypothetical protein
MAAEHAIISEPMELPSLPPNQGLEAMKDIIFGSVRKSLAHARGGFRLTPSKSRQEWQANSSSTPLIPSRSDYSHNLNTFLSDIRDHWIVSASPSEPMASGDYTEASVPP